MKASVRKSVCPGRWSEPNNKILMRPSAWEIGGAAWEIAPGCGVGVAVGRGVAVGVLVGVDVGVALGK